MSKFGKFFAADSDTESESESSEGEFQPQRPTTTKVILISDDEEETKRVVRSTKDKRYDNINQIIKKMKNFKKIKDMASLLDAFENLMKLFDKAKKIVEKEGVPRFYIRCIVELEIFVEECWEDRVARKQMSKNNAKGLTTLRQKIRRNNRDFESDILKYKENPDEGEEVSEEEEAGSGSESDGYVIPLKSKKVVTKAKALPTPREEGDSDASDSWPSSSDDDSGSSSDDDKYGGNLALKFLKKAPDEDKKEKESKKTTKEKTKDKKIKKDTGDDLDEGEWEQVTGGAPLIKEKPKMFAKDTEINHEAVTKKLGEIISARGKKGTDRNEMIDLLSELAEISDANNLGPAMKAKVLLNRVAAVFDYNPNIATCMKDEMWKLCLDSIRQLMTILEEHKDDMVLSENVLEDQEDLEGPSYRIRGCILTVVERMDEEFTKMLQACDAHSTEYVERLKDEKAVCDIITSLVELLENKATSEEVCRAFMRKIHHLYYKFDKAYYSRESTSVECEREMERMCQYIYTKDNTDRLRTQAMLCRIYHLALHDRWFKARDLMLMSHLQDSVQHSDVATQVKYNRTMVQLGLCAFRQGIIKDAHNCLVDIQSSGRAKELLAQGLLLQRQHERTPEQEKIEKRRQMPYHMHINLELLECVYLVSAMLLEIPYMAAHEFDARRRMISKNFHHVMRVSERQPLVGPPESMREHIVAASKAMKDGDWKACHDYIINAKMNTKVWELFYDQAKAIEMIEQKIQEESLRTYLFTFSSVYDTLSLETLAEMFQLDTLKVHSVISKMIINEELMASLDEPTQAVLMHRTEPTRLQAMALQLSEKVSSLVENNERIMEMKQGNFFFQNKFGDRSDGQGWQQNRQGNYGDYKRNQKYDRQGGNRYDRGGQKYDRQGGRYDRGGGGRY